MLVSGSSIRCPGHMQAAAVEACTIPEEELIQMTKDWVGTFNGLTDEQTSKLSDDFVYRGPGTIAAPPVRVVTGLRSRGLRPAPSLRTPSVHLYCSTAS